MTRPHVGLGYGTPRDTEAPGIGPGTSGSVFLEAKDGGGGFRTVREECTPRPFRTGSPSDTVHQCSRFCRKYLNDDNPKDHSKGDKDIFIVDQIKI